MYNFLIILSFYQAISCYVASSWERTMNCSKPDSVERASEVQLGLVKMIIAMTLETANLQLEPHDSRQIP